VKAGRATVAALVALAALGTLSGAFWLKDRCTRHAWDGFQYRSSCYNDLFALYGQRGLDREPFPYIHGDGHLDDQPGDLEYPVLTGVYVGLVASAVSDGVSFFRWSALGLGLAGLVGFLALVAMASDPRRLAYYGLAPPLFLYAFHNWDLLAVAPFALAMVAFHRRRDGWAGLWIGLGAAAKLYPAVLLPALALARWRNDDEVPIRLFGATVGSFLAVNLPIFLINPAGWFAPWRFHSQRFPNFETSWYFLYQHLGGSAPEFDRYARLTSVASGTLFLVAAGVLLWAEARRERVRPFVLAMGFVLLFLLTGKVYSPQYALWLLPLFVVVGMRWFHYVAFAITDVAVWVGISSYFLARQYGAGDETFRLLLTEIAVYVRYAVLVWLLWYSRRANELVAERDRAPARLESPV